MSNFNSENNVNKFNSSDKTTDFILDSYEQKRFINGEFLNNEVTCNQRFSLSPKIYRLVQQGLAVADQILKAQIDPAKICPDRKNARIWIAKTYVYSYFKSVNLAIKFPNIDVGEDNLVFRGHADLFNIINARNIRCEHSNSGSYVNKRIELSLEDDKYFWEQEYKFSWLRGASETTTSYRYYIREYEDILFKLKSLARTYTDKKYGLSYVINSINDGSSNSIIKNQSCYLGNAALHHASANSLYFIYSSMVKVTDLDVIINPALFITLVSQDFDDNLSEDNTHQPYRTFNYDNPMHLLRYEVKAVTGLYPGILRSNDTDILKIIDSPNDVPPSEDNKGDVGPSGNKP